MATKKLTLEFAAWEPDAPLFGGAQAMEARNVIPAKKGVRPLRRLVAVTPGIPAAPLALYSFTDASGVRRMAAASAGKVWSYEPGGGGTYEWIEKLSAANAWDTRSFAHYGDALYCCFGSDLYKAACTGASMGSFSAVSGAPSALVCASVRDFLVLGQLTAQPNAIRWSAIDDPDSWPAPGSDQAVAKQSDIQVFPEGGRVMAIAAGVNGLDALVFLERGIQRMQYVNAPYIFQFDWADRTRGTVSAKSVVNSGEACFFLSDDGFYGTNGAACRPIGRERVDRWFMDHADPARLGEVEGSWDPANGLAVWRFASQDCLPGMTDLLIMYSPLLDRWTHGETLARGFVRGSAEGATLEGLDAMFPDDTLDTLPVSLDSSLLKAGSPALMAASAGSKLSMFAGLPLQAAVSTCEAGGARIFVHGVKPLVNGGAAEASVSFRTRQADGRKSTEATKLNREGICPCRASGQYAAARVTVPAGVEWSEAVGCVLIFEDEGGF